MYGKDGRWKHWESAPPYFYAYDQNALGIFKYIDNFLGTLIYEIQFEKIWGFLRSNLKSEFVVSFWEKIKNLLHAFGDYAFLRKKKIALIEDLFSVIWCFWDQPADISES